MGIYESQQELAVRLVCSNRELFTRLLHRYMDHRRLKMIQRCKKVFYSETERDHYDRYLLEDLVGYYDFLFESMIDPIDRNLSKLKIIVSPFQLHDIVHGEKITKGLNIY